MLAIIGALVSVIVEALVTFFTQKFLMKAVVACGIYVFLFSIIPLLIQFLVPSAIMQAGAGFNSMLTGNQWGQNIAYILNWFQLFTAIEIALVALAVRFLFRRI